MNLLFKTSYAALLLTTAGLCAAGNEPTNEENAILALVLKRSFRDGGYTIVAADSGLFVGTGNPKETSYTQDYLRKRLETNGIVVKRLVTDLFERNKKPVRLTLKSAPKDGYVIDYDGKFANYFKEDGGGWEKWYKENPKAHGITTVSLPAYDPKTGLVLLYMGTQVHWLAGSGRVILYSYEKGELKELKRLEMWIS